MKKHLTITLCCLALVAFLAGGAVAEDKKPAAPAAPAKEEAAPVKDGKACEPKAGCDPAKCQGHGKDQAQSHEGCKAAPAKDQAGCCKGAPGKDQAGCAKTCQAKDAKDTKASPSDLGNTAKTK